MNAEDRQTGGEHTPEARRFREKWQWDDTLYGGSAPYYTRGRLPYPRGLAPIIQAELGLDGRGSLIDVGCGPGSLTLILAPLFQEAFGIDPDPGMIGEATRRAEAAGVPNVRWARMRAEDLPSGLGVFRVATFAQSFHWMNRPRVAATVSGMLEPGGWWIHVNATTHRGAETDEPLPYPSPPHEKIEALVKRYLGPVRRAGAGRLPHGTVAGEEEVMQAAGYRRPRRVPVPRGEIVERSVEDIVAAVLSLSWAAPHLFGEQLREFEQDLGALLRQAAHDGRFSEKARDIELVIWRKPA